MVTAKVHRDDGESGIVLRFHELSADAIGLLNKLVDSMPMLEPGEEDEAGGIVVSEILGVEELASASP